MSCEGGFENMSELSVTASIPWHRSAITRKYRQKLAQDDFYLIVNQGFGSADYPQ